MKSASLVLLGSLLALSSTATVNAAKKEITPETIREDLIAAHCKAEAKKYYSVWQLKKRRMFERNCVERAQR